jgi:hypothetical protein
LTRATVIGFTVRAMMELEQGCHTRINNQHNIAASTATSAVRPAEWLEFLTQHRGASVTSVATLYVQGDLVNKSGHD